LGKEESFVFLGLHILIIIWFVLMMKRVWSIRVASNLSCFCLLLSNVHTFQPKKEKFASISFKKKFLPIRVSWSWYSGSKL